MQWIKCRGKANGERGPTISPRRQTYIILSNQARCHPRRDTSPWWRSQANSGGPLMSFRCAKFGVPSLFGPIAAPCLDLGKERLWPLGFDPELAEENLAAIAIERYPIPFLKRNGAELSPVRRSVNHQA